MREGGLRGYVAGISIGLLMGIAERIPGASAASIALAFGAYPSLLTAMTLGHPQARVRGHGLSVGCGLGLLVSLTWGGETTAHWLLHAAVPVRAFFFGTIAAAVFLTGAGLRRWSIAAVWLVTFGAFAGVALARAAPEYLLVTSTLPIAIAALSSGALLLPGGFGSTLLVLSGVGDAAQAAWTSGDGWYLAVTGLGAVTGLLAFANVLWRALRRFPDETWAFLLGLMGSGLARLWPWQRIDAYTLTSTGEAAAVSTSPLLPWHYFATTGAEVQGLLASAAMVFAVALMVLVKRAAWQRASA